MAKLGVGEARHCLAKHGNGKALQGIAERWQSNGKALLHTASRRTGTEEPSTAMESHCGDQQSAGEASRSREEQSGAPAKPSNGKASRFEA